MLANDSNDRISPENVRIADFGLSLVFNIPYSKLTKRLCGTKTYMSPEQLKGQPYGKVTLTLIKPSDMYSLAIMTFYLMTQGLHPFSDPLTKKIDFNLQADPDWRMLDRFSYLTE